MSQQHFCKDSALRNQGDISLDSKQSESSHVQASSGKQEQLDRKSEMSQDDFSKNCAMHSSIVNLLTKDNREVSLKIEVIETSEGIFKKNEEIHLKLSLDDIPGEEFKYTDEDSVHESIEDSMDEEQSFNELFPSNEDLLNKSFEKKTLNPKAKEFKPIPLYDPTKDLSSLLAEIPQGTDPKLLVEKNYPSFLVHRYARSLVTNQSMIKYKSFDKKTIQEEVYASKEKRYSPDTTHYSYSHGEMSKHWRISLRKVDQPVLKPRVYNHGSFQQWVFGQAWMLWSKVPDKNKKKTIVTGNEACRALFYDSGSMNHKVADELLSKSLIYTLDFSHTGVSEPERFLLSDYIKEDKPTIQLFGENISDVEELIKKEYLFKRHAPLFRASLAYLCKETFISPQRYLNKHFSNVKEELQGRRFNCCDFTHKVELEEVNVKFSLDTRPLEMFAGLLTEEAISYTRFVTNLVAFLGAIFTSGSIKNMLFIVTQFITSNPLISKYCSKYIDVISNKLFGDVTQRQGFGDFQDLLKGYYHIFWDFIVETVIYSFLAEVKLTLFETCPMLVSDLVRMTKSQFMKDRASDLAKSLIEWIREIILRLIECWNMKSVRPLFDRRCSPTQWIKYSMTYISNYPILTNSSSVPTHAELEITKLVKLRALPHFWTSPVSIGHYLSIVEEHIVEGEELKKLLRNYPKEVERVQREFQNLVAHFEQIKITQISRYSRATPFFVVLYGVPGTGKTNLAQQLHEATQIHLQREEFSESTKHEWVIGSNFQDGLDHTISTIVMDDVDTSVAPMQAGVRNWGEEIMALVNNKPYAVEQARVERKGQIFANPKLLICCTNFRDIRATKATLLPEAVYRRINFHVTVKVKQEFQQEQEGVLNGLLDRNKALGSNTHDMWEFEVRRYRKNVSEGVDNDFLTDPVLMSYPAFMVLFTKEFKEHQDREKVLLARSFNQPTRCPNCTLTTDRECCGHQYEEHQGLRHVETVKSSFHMRVAIYAHMILTGTRGCSFRGYFQEYNKKLKTLQDMNDVDSESYLREIVNFYSRLPHDAQEGLFDDFIRISKMWEDTNLSSLPEEQMQPQSLNIPFLGFLTRPISRYLQTYVPGQTSSFYREMFIAVFTGFTTGSIAVLGSIVVSSFIIDKLHQITKQGRENNSTVGHMPKDWVRVDQNFVPNLNAVPVNTATWTYEDLRRAISDSYVTIRGPKFSMSGTCVGHNVILTCTHVANLGDEIFINQNGNTLSLTLVTENLRILPSNQELCLIYCPNLKGTLTILKKCPFSLDVSINQYDEIQIFGKDVSYVPHTNNMKMSKGSRVITTSAPTKDGDCGLLYVGKFGTSYKVVGMHYALHSHHTIKGPISESVAGVITQDELNSIAHQFGTILQGVTNSLTTLSKDSKRCKVVPLNMYSEVWSAISSHGVKHVFPMGLLEPPLSGSTIKAKTKFSLIQPFMEDLLDKYLEGNKQPFKIPNFRGYMKDDHKWYSAYSQMFATENLSQPDLSLMQLAVYDFLNGIDNLDCLGYQTLTEYEAVNGIPGSFIHSLNMQTSVGPPFNCNKKKHIYPGTDPLFSPEFAQQLDELKSYVESEYIVSPLAICSLKDEPMKANKEFPRVFNNLSASFNLISKQQGVWSLFMRNNPLFFESAVGINMSSSESLRVLNHLLSIDPSGQNCYDGDATQFDKSWNGYMFDYVSAVVGVMSFAIGCDQRINENLILSLKHMTYSVKNDLFRTFHNPSGNAFTVEINGLAISLGYRYVFYRENPPSKELLARAHSWYINRHSKPIPDFDEDLIFRREVKLVTYGDDNLCARLLPPGPNFCEIWKRELGIEMLDASKSSGMIKKNLFQISFLQRKWVPLEGVPFLVAKLGIKSLLRMMLFKKESTLSDLDHAATVSSDVLREAVYHGREFYQEMFTFLENVSEKVGYKDNVYFHKHTFDYFLEKVREDEHQTWSTRSPEPPNELDGYLTPQMSQINLVKDSSFESNPHEINAPPTVELPTGQIENSGMSMSENINARSHVQNMPPTTLNDTLTRATMVGGYTLNSANPATSVLIDINPWLLYLNNPMVIDKVKNFTYIGHATLQVIFKVTVPSFCYGGYVVTAVPQMGTSAAAHSPYLNVENCMQTDHCAFIDMASSNDVCFQLPFIADKEYLPFDSALGPTPASLWMIYITCLEPLKSGLAGTPPIANVKVYCNLMDDYDLVVPYFQGKLNANAALKHVSPKLHDAIGEGKASKALGAVAGVADSLSKVPVIGSFAQTAASVLHGAESIASWFGFTRNSNERNPLPIIQHSVTNVAHYDGEDSGQGASLSYVNEITMDSALIGFNEEDCLAVSQLYPRWTLVSRIPWNTTDPVNTILGVVPVSPSYAIDHGPQGVAMTVAGYIGLPFEYWSGDMEYKVVIFVSKAHRGVLQIAWVPFGSSPSGDITNLSWNTVYDVSSTGYHNITIGYAREIPFLPNRLLTNTMPVIPIGSANGNLLFRVVNPLTAPSDTAFTDVWVFARGGQNMEFGLPRDSMLVRNSSGDPISATISAQLSLQGGAVGDGDSPLQEVDVKLVPTAGFVESDKLYFGEKLTSVRSLLQKPSKLNVMQTNSVYIPYGLWNPGAPTGTAGNLPVWTWQGYYKNLFLGFACSERYKVFPKDPAWIGACRQNVVLNESLSSTPTLAPMTFCGPNMGAEFNIPYYHPRKFTVSRLFINNNAPGPNTLIKAYSKTGTPVDLIVYYSFGPDIRATCFRQVPRIFFADSKPVAYKEWW